MRITIEMIQHANAVTISVFCILYSLSKSFLSISIGVLVCVSALFFLYLPDIMTFPGVSEKEKRNGKKDSIIAGWFFALFFLGLISENNSMKIISAALLILFFVHFISNVIKWKKEHLHRE